MRTKHFFMYLVLFLQTSRLHPAQVQAFTTSLRQIKSSNGISVLPPGYTLAITSTSISYDGALSLDNSSGSLWLSDLLLAVVQVDASAPGAGLTLEKVNITASCQDLRNIQVAACSNHVSPHIQILPNMVVISKLDTAKLTAADVNVTTATDCTTAGYGSSNASLAALPSVPCISVAARSWADVRQALSTMQPVSASVRVVLAGNMSVDAPCASCGPAYASDCVCKEDGWPLQLNVYRNVTLRGAAAAAGGSAAAGGARTFRRPLLDLQFRGDIINLDVLNGASLTVEHLTVTGLPAGPADKFPRSADYTYGWFASFDRCLPLDPPIRLLNSTLVATSADLSYLGYWYRRVTSPSIDDVLSGAWTWVVGCDPYSLKPAVAVMQPMINGSDDAWSVTDRRLPGLVMQDSLLVSPQWLGLAGNFTSAIALTSIFLDPYHPTPQAHYVTDPASLIQALQAPKYPDIVLVANISVPPEALPAGGLDVPIEVHLHGWPGRPTVLDMQRASGVFRITNRVVLHNLWIMNTGVAPAGTYPQDWVNKTALWTFNFDRHKTLLEMRSSVLVVPPLNGASFGPGPDTYYLASLGLFKISGGTNTSITMQTLVLVSGIVGYDTTITNVSAAFTNLLNDVSIYTPEEGWPASSGSSSNGPSGASGSERQLPLGLAIGLPGGAMLLALVAAAAWRLRTLHATGASKEPGKGDPDAAVPPGAYTTATGLTFNLSNTIRQHASIHPYPHTTASTFGQPNAGSVLSPGATTVRAPDRRDPRVAAGNRTYGSGSSSSSSSSYFASDPFNAPCGTHSLMINQAGMSRELQQQLAADASGGLAERLNTMVARMQEELGNEEVVLERVVGQGANGVVYEGWWRGLRVACKTMTLACGPLDAGHAARRQHAAMNEVAVCRSLQHNNIVNAFGYHLIPLVPAKNSGDGTSVAPSTAPTRSGTTDLAQQLDYRLVLIQEFCEGGTLRDAIDDGLLATQSLEWSLAGEWSGKSPTRSEANTAAVVQLATDIAAGMSHIHSRNIIHSDLNPANILLKTCDYAPSRHLAKVADFGLALKLRGDQRHVSNMQRGTWHYIAPEVLGVGRLSKAADVYSFGVVLHEMWHGTPAWRREERQLRQQELPPYWAALLGGPHKARSAPDEPLQLSPSCPEGLRSLIADCTRREPESRPNFFAVVERLMALQRRLALELPVGAGSRGRHTPRSSLDKGATDGGTADRAATVTESGTTSTTMDQPHSSKVQGSTSARQQHNDGASAETAGATTSAAPQPEAFVTLSIDGDDDCDGVLDPAVAADVRAVRLQLVGATTGVVRSGNRENALARRAKQAEGWLLGSVSWSLEWEARSGSKLDGQQQQQQQQQQMPRPPARPIESTSQEEGSDGIYYISWERQCRTQQPYQQPTAGGSGDGVGWH